MVRLAAQADLQRLRSLAISSNALSPVSGRTANTNWSSDGITLMSRTGCGRGVVALAAMGEHERRHRIDDARSASRDHGVEAATVVALEERVGVPLPCGSERHLGLGEAVLRRHQLGRDLEHEASA